MQCTFWLVACAVIFTSCSDVRQEKKQASATGESADYQYPHPASWTSQHVEFVSKHGNAVVGTSKDCTTCHTEKTDPNSRVPKARPMNVTCAMACHTPRADHPDPTLPSRPPSQGQNECLKCHSEHAQRAKPHYPAAAGLCKTCHDVTPAHLANGGPNGATTKGPEQSCYSCHSRVDGGKEVHTAMTLDNSCNNCHDAHGSNTRSFLKKPTIEATCAQCHEMANEKHKSVHGPLKGDRSCLSCHSAHSSEHKKVLTAKPRELCLSCHDREIQTAPGKDERTIPDIKEKIMNAAFTHSPALGDEGCIDCHNPHASKYDRLAKKAYPGDSYAPYVPGDKKNPNTYALCFSCHDKGMLNKDLLNRETGFRDDHLEGTKVVSKNLHWFHVVDAAGSANKQSGRSCFTCHDPHGAAQPHNIKNAWRMSKSYSVGIEFTPTAKGGQCTKSCHDLRTYKRAE